MKNLGLGQYGIRIGSVFSKQQASEKYQEPDPDSKNTDAITRFSRT